MIITPPIDELSNKVTSRYELVTAVAKRSREIIVNEPHLIDKPVAKAVDELYEDKIVIVHGTDE